MFKQSEKQIKKDFSFSIIDGIFWILMNSIALTFIIPYIISLGANPFQVGLIQSFPLFITSFLVLISYKVLKRFNSKKHSVVFFITLQSLTWIPLALAHYFFSDFVTIWVVIFIYTLITGLGVVVHPIYMDWIRKLFPVSRMGFFIARKNIILELISIIPIILIGYFLDLFNDQNYLLGFTIIFLCAGLFRFLSSRYLNKMSATENKEDILNILKKREKEKLSRNIKKTIFKDKSFLKYLIFVIISFIGVHLATSYVTYFVLNQLNYTTVEYIWWRVAFILGMVSSLGYWGYVSDKYSSVKVMQVSSFFLPFFLIVPAFFYNSYLLMVISIFVFGVIFGAFNLSILNYLFKNIKKDLISYSSYFTIVQSTSIFIGTLLGAFIIFLATKFYDSEFKAIIFLFILTIIYRFIPFIYSLSLERLQRRDLRFFKYVIFQRPVFYGLLEFTSLSHEDKKILLELNLKDKMKVIKKIRKKN